MAEELLRKMAPERFECESAGIEPGALNPVVVEVLKEEGIDIAGKATRAVADLIQRGARYDYVVTVCDETSAERCPTFPGRHTRIHWGFPDPSRFAGTFEEKLRQTCAVKDEIKRKLLDWLKEIS